MLHQFAGGFEKRLRFEVVGELVETSRIVPCPQTHRLGLQDKRLRLPHTRGLFDSGSQSVVENFLERPMSACGGFSQYALQITVQSHSCSHKRIMMLFLVMSRCQNPQGIRRRSR